MGNKTVEGKLALTIGTFDGVHIGHQVLLDETRRIAEERDISSAAYTYEVPPKRYLNGSGPPLIMEPGEKLELLRSYVGRTILGDFLEVKNYTPRRYVEEILIDRLDVDAIVVGYEWRFGRDRSGSYRDLKRFNGGRFSVHPQRQIKKEGKPVSSTWIREAISEGEISLAKRLLGRYPRYSGKVIRGHQVGEKIGFPTANIRPDERVVLPKRGNYASFVEFEGERYGAAVHVGNRPTFEEGKGDRIEVHVLDYEGNLYGKEIEVTILKYLGQSKKYKKKEELRQAIEEYVMKTERVLEETKVLS